MTGGPLGVLVMAYGTPASPADIETYYTHIRHGRPPTDEQLSDLTRRYDAIGGISPLAERTELQRAAIARELAALGTDATVVLGQKHAPPFIEDGIDALVDNGVDHMVGIVLAPHFSRASVGEYHVRAATRAGQRSVAFRGIMQWHLEPSYVTYLTDVLRAVRATAPERHKVLFTAHSLPERVLIDDPYPEQLRAGASAVASRLDMSLWSDWALCWQSAGRTADPWRGPDIRDVIRELASTGHADGVVVCPHGFTSDHLEVLYDLDIEAAAVARDVGLQFSRSPVVNADTAVMHALAKLVLAG